MHGPMNIKPNNLYSCFTRYATSKVLLKKNQKPPYIFPSTFPPNKRSILTSTINSLILNWDERGTRKCF